MKDYVAQFCLFVVLTGKFFKFSKNNDEKKKLRRLDNNNLKEMREKISKFLRFDLDLKSQKSNQLDDSASSSIAFAELLSRQVVLAFSTLESILTVAQSQPESKIEELLISRSDGSESVGSCLLRAVSAFIFNRSDNRLPTDAIRLLRRLCYFKENF